VAEVPPLATVTEEGSVRKELLSESVTTPPPLGALLFKVTVQVVVRPPSKLDALHPTDDNVIGATTVTVAVLEVRL
jgi:hypothetical protein